MRKPYSRCVVTNGTAQCVCPKDCPDSNQTVCGSDRKNYNNECDLKKAACSDNKRLFVIRRGKCPGKVWVLIGKLYCENVKYTVDTVYEKSEQKYCKL